MGLPPISTIGLGLISVSSLILVPNPPAKMTTFIYSIGGGKSIAKRETYHNGISCLKVHKLNSGWWCDINMKKDV